MALAGVLSAVRELILDDVAIPANQDERRTAYRERFSTLSADEIDDLAKMDPQRLGIYTTSVFSAESSILKNYFPCTMAIVEKHYEDAIGTPFDSFRFCRAIHATFPWRGIHSDGLGRCFLNYLSSCCAGLLVKEPALLEMAALEQASLEIRKAPNGSYRAQPGLMSEIIATMTVDALLETPIIVPQLVHRLDCHFQVRYARSYFLSHDRTLPDCIAEGACSLVGGRPADYGSAWEEVPSSLADLIISLQSESDPAQRSISALASRFVECVPEAAESEVFNDFIKMLGTLVQAGVVVVLYPATYPAG